MIFQRIPAGEDLQAEGGAEAVLLADRVPDLLLLLLGAHGEGIAEVGHFQRRDIRLKEQLGDIRRGGGAPLQLLLDMFQFAGAPVLLPLRFPPRQLPAGEAHHP